MHGYTDMLVSERATQATPFSARRLAAVESIRKRFPAKGPFYLSSLSSKHFRVTKTDAPTFPEGRFLKGGSQRKQN
jgi:hypothetical protein